MEKITHVMVYICTRTVLNPSQIFGNVSLHFKSFTNILQNLILKYSE